MSNPNRRDGTALSEQQRIAALEATVRRYRAIVEDGLGLICVHEMDGTLVSISPAAADILEYRPAEMVGKSVAAFVPADFRPFFGDYLDRMAANQVDVGMMRLLTRGGEERLWTYRNVLMESSDGRPQVLGHAHDITALHRTRNELRDARAHLEDRVRQRTSELVESNRRLQKEIAERKAAEAELRASRKRLELFHEIAIHATRCSRDELRTLVVERCATTLERVAVSFVKRDGDRFVVSESTDQAPEWQVGSDASLKDAYLTQLARGDMVVSDVAAMVAYPMREEERLLGFLVVRAPGPRTWAPYETEIVREVAGFLSLALRRSGAYPAIAEDAA